MSTPTKAAPAATLEYVKTIGIVNNGGQRPRIRQSLRHRGHRRRAHLRAQPLRPAARASSIRIGICNLDEEYLGEFPMAYGQGDGQVTLPVCLAFDSGERLYVTDENNHRVSVFDLSGRFIGRWGSRGSGDGESSTARPG